MEGETVRAKMWGDEVIWTKDMLKRGKVMLLYI